MAFPSTANQDVTKKILEDIQMKKQLLQKGVNSHPPGFGNLYNTPPGFGSLYTPSPLFQLPKADRYIMACIKLKQLEQLLQTVDDFNEPKVRLEQYTTPSHIASQALYAIQTRHGDLEGQVVLDLGCGPGMLSIGAALLGADFVLGVEIDQDAIEVFRSNCEEFELDNVQCVQADVLQLPEIVNDHQRQFDTVLLNPPFGTKQNSGIDMAFLKIAITLARGAVYSEHVKKKALEWKVRPSLIAELRYNLPQTYKFHKRTSVDVAVDLWRFECVDTV
uniref:Methyltransferase domain-containing protein n=1 Tax=Anopheles epiroticus TaxID=199890 RepID=A0A182PI16_9DIPT